MVDIPHSSFIPRESTGMTPGKVRRTRTFHVFGFIATALLIGSMVTAGGSYFLKKSAVSNLESAQSALRAQKDLFKPESIAELREFSRRIQAAEQLIGNHISPLQIFVALEKYTKQKVQFTSFTLEHTPALEVIVSLQGKTPEFKTLALQESGFAADTLMKSVVFSEVSTSDSKASEDQSNERNVIFSLKGVIDTSQILYNGIPAKSFEQTAFIEVDTEIFASEEMREEDGVVLGDSLIAPSL